MDDSIKEVHLCSQEFLQEWRELFTWCKKIQNKRIIRKDHSAIE